MEIVKVIVGVGMMFFIGWALFSLLKFLWKSVNHRYTEINERKEKED